MTRTLMLSTVAALFTAGVASADMSWDANADSMIDADEYTAGMESDTSFDAWDADDDGMLSRDEWAAGNWRAYDTDEDEMWSEDEANVFRDMVTRTGEDVSQ